MADMQTDEVARYGRWLKRSVGTAFRIGVGSAAGELLWADGNDAAPLASALATCIALPHDGSEGMRRQEADGATAYTCPIKLPAGAGDGWLLALPDRETPPTGIELNDLAETMGDVATTLADGSRLNAEMDVLATELAERYEELHLFYDIDRHLAKKDLGTEVLQDLLRTCADELLLVADGKAIEFDGDLDDYAAWLASQRNAERTAEPEQAAEKTERLQSRADSKASRQALLAQRRPLIKEIEQLEKKIAKWGEEKAALDAQFADPKHYVAVDRQKSEEMHRQAGLLGEQIDTAEMRWLEVHEALEALPTPD